jgi:poly(3-hydroxybutyrate) depolymerase
MLWYGAPFTARADWRALLGVEQMSTTNLGSEITLLSFDQGEAQLPRLLIVPPASGHSSTLMADLTMRFRDRAEIHILHLHDPSDQPQGSKAFGVKDQIAGISRALGHLRAQSGAPLWCLTACQASGPTLMAATKTPPDALTLIAAPIVPDAAPGGAAALFEGDAEDLFRQIYSATTIARNGRRILPSSVQMAAILQGQGGAARILARETYSAFGPMTLFANNRMTARQRGLVLTDGQNIDARLLEEGLRFNFIDRPFARAQSAVADLSIPILAIAGEADQVVPAAQCHGVSTLCPQARVQHHLATGLDHFDLFVGDQARNKVGKTALSFFEAELG